jgi:urea transport system permease protein
MLKISGVLTRIFCPLRLAAMALLVTWGPVTVAQDATTVLESSPKFEAVLTTFAENEDRQTADLITALEESLEPSVKPFLVSLLEGEVYMPRNNPRVAIASESGSDLILHDVLTSESLGVFGSRDVQRVSLNNSLRRRLRVLIADLDLANGDPIIRLEAVNYLMSQGAESSRDKLEALQAAESNAKVLLEVDAALALLALSSEDASVRDGALDSVEGNLNNAIRNKLASMAQSDPNEELRLKAQSLLDGIAEKIKWLGYLETLFFGVSLGSVLLLAAIGLAITFGVMGVINMAHGELIMLGAYTTFVVQQLMPNHIEISIIVAIPAAFMVSALFGIAIERGVIRFLYGRPLETLLATFGISLVLQQMVRSVFSPLNRSVTIPQWMSGQWEVNEVLSLTYNRLYIIIFCLIVFFLLSMLLKKTRLGIEVRAVAQNRAMARAIGVRSNRVDALTFGLGSGVAGIAGVALSQLTNVGPNMGQAYIVDSFMVVVFGGVGNLWGAFFSSFILGIANKILEPAAGAVLAKILILVFIILFIQKQPRGLFPAKGRGVED